MLLKRTGLPEEGEHLLCEVKNVHFHSVFVKILEYGIEGMIHISEIAPGRIRNIRDYVKEGKFIVCKALRVKHDRNQVDLSLRRVNERERRAKVNLIALEKKTEKLIAHATKELKLETKDVYKKIIDVLFEDYDFLSEGFMDISEGKYDIKNLKLEPKLEKKLLELIKDKIKAPEISIKGHLNLTTYEEDGVEHLKKTFTKILKEMGDKFTFKYEGGGHYSVVLVRPNYETAEKDLKKFLDFVNTSFTENSDVAFERV